MSALPPEWTERYEAICGYVDTDKATNPAKVLVAVEDVLASRLRRARADVKRLQAQVNALAPTAPRPAPEAIREARKAYEEYTALKDRAARASEKIPMLRSQLAEAQLSLNKAKAEYNRLEQESRKG